VIITGGPGTGKSVIAVALLGELAKANHTRLVAS
jgi:DNA replication protein DnaC